MVPCERVHMFVMGKHPLPGGDAAFVEMLDSFVQLSPNSLRLRRTLIIDHPQSLEICCPCTLTIIHESLPVNSQICLPLSQRGIRALRVGVSSSAQLEQPVAQAC